MENRHLPGASPHCNFNRNIPGGNGICVVIRTWKRVAWMRRRFASRRECCNSHHFSWKNLHFLLQNHWRTFIFYWRIFILYKNWPVAEESCLIPHIVTIIGHFSTINHHLPGAIPHCLCIFNRKFRKKKKPTFILQFVLEFRVLPHAIIFDTKSIIFDTKSIIFDTKSIIVNTKSIIFDAKFIILNAKFSTCVSRMQGATPAAAQWSAVSRSVEHAGAW